MQPVRKVREPQQRGDDYDCPGSHLYRRHAPHRDGGRAGFVSQAESGAVENEQHRPANDQIGVERNAHQHEPLAPREISQQTRRHHGGYAAGQQRGGTQTIEAAHRHHRRLVKRVFLRDVPVLQHLLVNVHHDGAPRARRWQREGQRGEREQHLHVEEPGTARRASHQVGGQPLGQPGAVHGETQGQYADEEI